MRHGLVRRGRQLVVGGDGRPHNFLNVSLSIYRAVPQVPLAVEDEIAERHHVVVRGVVHPARLAVAQTRIVQSDIEAVTLHVTACTANQ